MKRKNEQNNAHEPKPRKVKTSNETTVKTSEPST